MADLRSHQKRLLGTPYRRGEDHHLAFWCRKHRKFLSEKKLAHCQKQTWREGGELVRGCKNLVRR